MDNDIIGFDKPLPRLKKIAVLNERKIYVVFNDGKEKQVDLMPALESRRIYIHLREDDALFRRGVIDEYGDAIEWDMSHIADWPLDGEGRKILDFSAEWLERLPDIRFSNEDFRASMEKLNMSLEGMASQLEISRRQVASYRKDKPIPRHIALATRYLVENSLR